MTAMTAEERTAIEAHEAMAEGIVERWLEVFKGRQPQIDFAQSHGLQVLICLSMDPAISAAVQQERNAIRQQAEAWAREPEMDGCCINALLAFAEQIEARGKQREATE